MKFLALFSVFLIFVELSQQLPHLKNCTEGWEIIESVATYCGVFTCDGPTRISGNGCGQWRCPPGKKIGYKPSNATLPYPDCCGGPICKD